jgi:putative ABC transport system substrate-binding protein
MRRHDFIAGLGGAVAWPVVGQAQQPMPLIGFIGTESPRLFEGQLRASHQGLGETGYYENRNISVEYRWAGGQIDLFPVLAADLVMRRTPRRTSSRAMSFATADGDNPTSSAAAAKVPRSATR